MIYNLLRLVNLAPKPGDVQATLPLSLAGFCGIALFNSVPGSYPTFESRGYIIYHGFIRPIEIEGGFRLAIAGSNANR